MEVFQRKILAAKPDVTVLENKEQSDRQWCHQMKEKATD